MKKILILLFLVLGTLYSQIQWEKQFFSNGVQFSLRITGLDTVNASKVSSDLDISVFDRAYPIYYWIRTTGDDVDTLQANIEGKFTNGTNSTYDTLVTLLPSNGQAGYTDTLNTQTGTTTPLPEYIRIRVNAPDLTSSISSGVFEMVIFGRQRYSETK